MTTPFDMMCEEFRVFFGGEEAVIERDMSRLMTDVLEKHDVLRPFLEALSEDAEEPSDDAKRIGNMLVAFGAIREEAKGMVPERLREKVVREIGLIGAVLVQAIYNMGYEKGKNSLGADLVSTGMEDCSTARRG